MFTRTRDLSKYNNLKTFRYSEANELVSSNISSGLHTLHSNNRYFDFIYENKQSNILFVTFGAAAGVDKPTYPVFSRLKMASLAGVDCLALSDVGQSSPENLKTTWHLGTHKLPTNELIVKLIRRLIAKYKYKTVILFGSSAGGFAALNTGRKIPGSIVVVMNPRTDLLMNPTTYDEFISKAYSNNHSAVSENISMCDAYSVPTGNRVIYIQNMEDEVYYKNHFIPFFEKNINHSKIISGNWGSGHVIPPRWVFEGVLQFIFNNPDSIDQFMELNMNSGMVGNKGDINILSQHVIGASYKTRSDDRPIADRIVSGFFTLPGRPPFEIGYNFDWNSDPYQDNNWKFNLHSLRWTDPLRRMYLKTRRQDYLDKYREILYSWYDFHVIRGLHTPYSWYDMASGSRVKVIAAAMQLMPDEHWLSHLLHLHGDHLSDDKFLTRKGNHALHAMTGLLVCGHFFKNDIWLKRSLEKISSLFIECVDSFGVDYEGALQYQINNFIWYSEAAQHILVATGSEPPFKSRLSSMPSFLAHAVDTTGHYLQYGDSDRMQATNSLESKELAWAGSRGLSGVPPTESYANYSAGYVFGRSGWSKENFEDGIFYSVRYGPSYSSTPHGQRDAGSITLSRGESEYLFESGRFRYDDSPQTSLLSSPKSHSTINIIDSSSTDHIPMNCINRNASELFDWTSLRRDVEGDHQWSRSVLHLRELKSLLVVDDFLSASPKSVEQYWQLAISSKYLIGKTSLVSSSDDQDHSLCLHWLSHDGASVEVVEGERSPLMGWRSIKHGEIFPSPVVRRKFFGTEMRIVTLVSFFKEDNSGLENNRIVQSNFNFDEAASKGASEGTVSIVDGLHRFDVTIPRREDLPVQGPFVTKSPLVGD